MAITWEVVSIMSLDDLNFRTTIRELVNGVPRNTYSVNNPKTAKAEDVIKDLAQVVHADRLAKKRASVPFETIDLSNFEARIKPV